MKKPMKRFCFSLLLCGSAGAQDDLSKQLLGIKRIYVDRLTGGETAAQMRDLIIASLHAAQAICADRESGARRRCSAGRGRGPDLHRPVQSSDSVDLRSGIGTGSRSTRTCERPQDLSASA